MTQHAELGASSSARWMACPGSVPLSRPYEGRSTLYAAEGTIAHALAAASLAGAERAPVGAVLETGGHQVVVTTEMDDAVDTYLNFVNAIKTHADWWGFEKRVHIFSAPLGSECWGTADFLAVTNSVLDVVDLKFGRGVAVDAESNSQTLFYGLAAYETVIAGKHKSIETLRLTIIQPRIDGAMPKTWDIDLIDLLIWRDSKFIPAVKRIMAGDQTLQDGPWCRFCPALAACPLKHQLAQEAAKLAFDDAPNSEDVSPAELGDRLRLALRLEDWANALKAEATELIHRGEDVPGWKLVEGRSNRKWIDDDPEILSNLVKRGGFNTHQAEAFYAPPTLQSPTQLEKLLKRWKYDPVVLLKGLILKPPGKPALVPDADPRPAMRQMTAAEAFRDANQEV